MFAFPVNTWFHSLGTVFFLTFYLWHPPSNLDPKTSFYGLLFTVSFLPLLYFFFYKPTCFWVASNCVNPPSQDASYLVKKKKWAKCFFFIKILQKSISFLCLLLRSNALRMVMCSVVGWILKIILTSTKPLKVWF